MRRVDRGLYRRVFETFAPYCKNTQKFKTDQSQAFDPQDALVEPVLHQFDKWSLADMMKMAKATGECREPGAPEFRGIPRKRHYQF